MSFPSRTGALHLTRESIDKAYRVTLELEGKHTPTDGAPRFRRWHATTKQAHV